VTVRVLSYYNRCTDGRKPEVPVVSVVVKAAAAKPKYIITLGGTTEMVREERDVSHGTAIFRDLLILAMPAAVKTADVRLPCKSDCMALIECLRNTYNNKQICIAP